MKLALALLLLQLRTARGGSCTDATECSECTSDSSCGWCDGMSYYNNVIQPYSCLDQGDAWTCDGAFKTREECDCATGGAPGALVNNGVWRGFAIDGSPPLAAGELSLEFAYGGASWGRATVVTSDGAASVANVSSIFDCTRGSCDGDQFFHKGVTS